jgi:hypothetical protein
MSVLAWIILGLISGFLASKIVNKTGEGEESLDHKRSFSARSVSE